MSYQRGFYTLSEVYRGIIQNNIGAGDTLRCLLMEGTLQANVFIIDLTVYIPSKYWENVGSEDLCLGSGDLVDDYSDYLVGFSSISKDLKIALEKAVRGASDNKDISFIPEKMYDLLMLQFGEKVARIEFDDWDWLAQSSRTLYSALREAHKESAAYQESLLLPARVMLSKKVKEKSFAVFVEAKYWEAYLLTINGNDGDVGKHGPGRTDAINWNSLYADMLALACRSSERKIEDLLNYKNLISLSEALHQLITDNPDRYKARDKAVPTASSIANKLRKDIINFDAHRHLEGLLDSKKR